MKISVPEAVTVLERTPLLLHTWIRPLSTTLLDANEGANTFTPREVVAHLIHGEEEDWMPRVRILLQHGEDRPFEPFDRRGFQERYAKLSLSELLDRFEVVRDESLAALRSLHLTAEQLELKGTHPDFGCVTLEQMLSTWVVHDLSHVAQIARVMAKALGDDVGPWRAYLPILNR